MDNEPLCFADDFVLLIQSCNTFELISHSVYLGHLYEFSEIFCNDVCMLTQPD